MSAYADTIHRVMAGDFGSATDAEKEEAVREVIQVCSIASAAIAIQPIPFVDLALLAPIQIVMVQAVGRVYGYRLDRKAVLEIISTFGASIVARHVVIAAAKFVPVIGWLASVSMAYALTYAMGEVSACFFRSGRGVAPDDLKSMFEKIYKKKKAEKEAEHKGDATLR